MRRRIRPRLSLGKANAPGASMLTCQWPSLRVGASSAPGRGLGLFAAKTLKRGTRIDYVGMRLALHSLQHENNDRGLAGDGRYYVQLACSPDGAGGDIIDANPAWCDRWRAEGGGGELHVPRGLLRRRDFPAT